MKDKSPPVLEWPVKQAHIDAGGKGSCEHCPLALAIHDACDRVIRVSIEDSGPLDHKNRRRIMRLLTFRYGDKVNEVWELDAPSVSATLHFDRSGRMKPFTARARLVDQWT